MPSPPQLHSPPYLPSLHIAPSVLRQIKTLLLCSTTPQEHLANLHLTRHSIPTTTPSPTYQISTLSLPSPSPPPHPSTRLIPITPNPTPPRHIRDLSLPLSASAALTPASTAALILHAHARTLRYALDAAVSFAARDADLFAQSALGIVLTGGGTLREGEYMGVLRMRNMGHGEVLEAVGADAEGDAGVWLLGGGEYELWEALNGFAERVAKRRNRRLGRKEASRWLAREIVVLCFSDSGEAVVRRGWMRVLCGKEGVERYCAHVSENGEARFVRERSGLGVSFAEVQSSRLGGGGCFEGDRRVGSFVPRRGAGAEAKMIDKRRDMCQERSDLDGEETGELRKGGKAQSSEEEESYSRAHTEAMRTVFMATGSGDDEETMNVMCLKYLCSSYAKEIERHMGTQA